MDDHRVQPQTTHYVRYIDHPKHYVWATGGTKEHCDRECEKLKTQGVKCKVVERVVFDKKAVDVQSQ